MKNLSIILNVILFVALIVLYVLHFSSKNDLSATTGTNIEGENMEAIVSSVVYVREDSMLSKYDFFLDELMKLEEKRITTEQNYRSRAEGLQSEIESFQRSRGNMTINQGRAVEEDLMRKQQNLLQYQETLSQELMREEARINELLYEKIITFLEGYAAENNYRMVLNLRRGNALLFAEKGMNITNDVVLRLNENYAREKQSVPVFADTTSTN